MKELYPVVVGACSLVTFAFACYGLFKMWQGSSHANESAAGKDAAAEISPKQLEELRILALQADMIIRAMAIYDGSGETRLAPNLREAIDLYLKVWSSHDIFSEGGT